MIGAQVRPEAVRAHPLGQLWLKVCALAQLLETALEVPLLPAQLLFLMLVPSPHVF